MRWAIAVLLLLVSVMNYVDRQTLSILARTIQEDLGISDAGYAQVVLAFQVTYAVMYLMSGRILDRVGTRLGQFCFIVWWSVANMLTGLASGVGSLAACRSLLGMGEPGGYTASAKAVSEWFPVREKGMAVGLYTMGGTLGAAIAGPSVALITARWGWRMSFFATGALGLLLAVLWVWIYRRPGAHPNLSDAERAYLTAEGVLDEKRDAPRRLPWRELAGIRPMWLVLVARMITDPVWYFYLFWFPKYLQDARGFTLREVGGTLWIVFVAADLGSLLGGWLSGWFQRRGMSPIPARLRVMSGAAIFLLLSGAMPFMPGKAWPIALASLLAFAHMGWMTCITTFSVDIFPSSIIGSAHGAIGAGSAFGGLVSTAIVGWLVTHFSYGPTFFIMSVLHPAVILGLCFRLPQSVDAYRRGLQ
ncbi:MAG: MFS transporter [Blastocatellia bacterium]|nr:MFS transporter [Blastocatellia bacterium]